MDKKALAKSSGHLARNVHGCIDPVRVVDTKNLWRKTAGTKRTLTLAHGATRASATVGQEVGYPVLSIYASRALSPEALAAAEKFLAETTVTMADLVDADGHDIDGVLPEDIILRIVDNRYLLGEYTTVKAEQDASWVAFVAQQKADEAAREAAWQARQASFNTKAEEKKAQAAKFVDELGKLGVNNMITMVTEHSVMVDVRTLEALIELAQHSVIIPDPHLNEV